MKCDVWKLCRAALTGQATSFNSLKIIIYCVTEQPSTQSWRFVLNFNSHFSVLTFLRLMNCLISIQQELCTEKFFQVQWLQYMSNTMICIDKRFVVKNSGISCLALLVNLGNHCQSDHDNPAHKKFGSRLQDMTSHIPFYSDRLLQTDGLAIKLTLSK